jgi:hypothetical protein
MKNVVNTKLSVQSFTLRPGDTGLTSAKYSLSPGVTLVAQSEQLATAPEFARDDSTWIFFAVGLAINIAVMSAYFIWAYRQWNKKGGKSKGD